MPCPVCNRPVAPTTQSEHRLCILTLFKDNRIQSVAEWEKLAKDKPKTRIKGTIEKRLQTSE
jgi:hypothetical protein